MGEGEGSGGVKKRKGLNSFGGVLAEAPFRNLSNEGVWDEYWRHLDMATWDIVSWDWHEAMFMICREFRERGISP